MCRYFEHQEYPFSEGSPTGFSRNLWWLQDGRFDLRSLGKRHAKFTSMFRVGGGDTLENAIVTFPSVQPGIQMETANFEVW